jgi:single-strand DNA-binding protein
MINKVILIGNIGKDPEVKTLESGATFAKVTLATNESYKDKAGEWQTITEWHNLIFWGDSAKRVEKTLSKGKLIYAEGKLSTRSYQDSSGQTKYVTEVKCNTFRLLEKKEITGQAQSNVKASNTDVPEIDDDMATDLPF